MYLFLLSSPPLPPSSTLFPYTTLFRSDQAVFGKLSRETCRHPAFAEIGGSGFEHRILQEGQEGRHFHGYTKVTSPFARSEEHTSELQSRFDLVCRLLLEKKKLVIII